MKRSPLPWVGRQAIPEAGLLPVSFFARRSYGWSLGVGSLRTTRLPEQSPIERYGSACLDGFPPMRNGPIYKHNIEILDAGSYERAKPTGETNTKQIYKSRAVVARSSRAWATRLTAAKPPT